MLITSGFDSIRTMSGVLEITIIIASSSLRDLVSSNPQRYAGIAPFQDEESWKFAKSFPIFPDLLMGRLDTLKWRASAVSIAINVPAISAYGLLGCKGRISLEKIAKSFEFSQIAFEEMMLIYVPNNKWSSPWSWSTISPSTWIIASSVARVEISFLFNLLENKESNKVSDMLLWVSGHCRFISLPS